MSCEASFPYRLCLNYCPLCMWAWMSKRLEVSPVNPKSLLLHQAVLAVLRGAGSRIAMYRDRRQRRKGIAAERLCSFHLGLGLLSRFLQALVFRLLSQGPIDRYLFKFRASSRDWCSQLGIRRVHIQHVQLCERQAAICEF